MVTECFRENGSSARGCPSYLVDLWSKTMARLQHELPSCLQGGERWVPLAWKPSEDQRELGHEQAALHRYSAVHRQRKVVGVEMWT
jgi:hypothetical protein